MKYAGIGARETPPDVLARMTKCAQYLNSVGYTLLSGGARGADSAFEAGAGDNKIIFKKESAKGRLDAMELAEQFHPAWKSLSPAGKLLQARNNFILLDEHLDEPVEFAVCWTPKGETVGGTGQAIRVARHFKIPIYNLFFEWNYRKLYEHVKRAKAVDKRKENQYAREDALRDGEYTDCYI